MCVHKLCNLYIQKYLCISGAIALNQGTFSEIGLPIVLQDLDCNGTEPSLLDCYTNDDADCKDFLDAGVICQGMGIECKQTSLEIIK